MESRMEISEINVLTVAPVIFVVVLVLGFFTNYFIFSYLQNLLALLFLSRLSQNMGYFTAEDVRSH